MKATGIVRRVDDLGRIVIPKEIRRVMNISNGDAMEIYTENDGKLILGKFSPVKELKAYAIEIAKALNYTLNADSLICDKDSIVCAYGENTAGLIGKPVSEELSSEICDRCRCLFTGDECIPLIQGDTEIPFSEIIIPVISDGQTSGAVVIMVPPGSKKELGEKEFACAEIAAGILGSR